MNTNNQEDRSTQKKHHNLKIYVITIISSLFLIAAAYITPLFTNKAETESLIKIPKGSSKDTIIDSISKYQGETFANNVSLILSILNTDLSKRHGAYMITKNMTPIKAAKIIYNGTQHPIRLPLIGSRTQNDLADRIAKYLDISKEEMLSTLNNPEIISEFNTDKENIIALFMNDSYDFYWSATPKDVINKMNYYYNLFWNSDRIQKAEALGLSPKEIMIIASITDEETNKADEKGKVGRLYINRLKKGMKLQADPTIRFALNDFSIKRILNKHLTIESPYNTYKIIGLPPGPIRTTSKQTIDAILNSNPSDHIFMCAKEDFSGYHNFATDYATHLKNAKKYQDELNKRNIN